MKKLVQKHKIWQQLYMYSIIALGSAIYAIGVDGFLVAHKLVSTGFSGISIIFYYLCGIPIGTMNLLLNIPVLLATWKWLGKSYIGITLFGTLVTSIFINQFMFVADYQWTHDPLVSSICSGILTGLGLGLVFRVGGNTGGLDPIAFIIRKYWGIQLGTVSSLMNLLILLGGAVAVGLEPAVITLVSVFVFAYVSNKVVVGFGQRKAVFIITEKTDVICDAIITQMGRGATILSGVGAYTRQPKQVVLVAVNLLQVARLKSLVDALDERAFMLITDAAEVVGAGFTKPTIPTPQEVLEHMGQVAEKAGDISATESTNRQLRERQLVDRLAQMEASEHKHQ